jgi:hypothetical protein
MLDDVGGTPSVSGHLQSSFARLRQIGPFSI